MRSQPDLPKSERFAEFLKRLRDKPLAASFEQAFDDLCTVLNDVEDSMTSIPFNPELWLSDGRMYPPQADNIWEVEGHPKVKRFRSRGHNTYIAENGAIEIRSLTEEAVVLTKLGADGREVWQQ